jgi:hypothetical protein
MGAPLFLLPAVCLNFLPVLEPLCVGLTINRQRELHSDTYDVIFISVYIISSFITECCNSTRYLRGLAGLTSWYTQERSAIGHC